MNTCDDFANNHFFFFVSTFDTKVTKICARVGFFSSDKF